MRPLNTAIVVEGATDETFLRILVERTLREIGEVHEGCGFEVAEPLVFPRSGENPWERLCAELCSFGSRLSIAFFHYDGTSKPERESRKCWDPMLAEWGRNAIGGSLCPTLLPLVPIKEMESWALADLAQVNRLAGVDVGQTEVFEVGNLTRVEKLSDPKRTLKEALRSGQRRKRRDRPVHEYLRILAESVSLGALRQVPSFAEWRDQTIVGLRDLGFIS